MLQHQLFSEPHGRPARLERPGLAMLLLRVPLLSVL